MEARKSYVRTTVSFYNDYHSAYSDSCSPVMNERNRSVCKQNTGMWVRKPDVINNHIDAVVGVILLNYFPKLS